MNKFFLGVLVLSLIGCSTPTPEPVITPPANPDASGTWKGQILYVSCYPGQKADISFVFAKKSSSDYQYIGTLTTPTATGAINMIYSATDKNFFLVSEPVSSWSFTLSISSDLKLMTGTFRQPGASSCSVKSETAEATVSLTKS